MCERYGIVELAVRGPIYVLYSTEGGTFGGFLNVFHLAWLKTCKLIGMA